MSDSFIDKNQVTALLNAYSIQEITSVFAEIDEKILALHECSSEDFLTLNAYFKKYYSDSKTISNNANTLFNIIGSEDNFKKILILLKKYQEDLQSLLLTYELTIDKVIQSTNRLVLEMDQMFVTANNLKQDLMTLKLLVANLKIDITASFSPVGKISTKTNDFNDLIIQTRSFFIEFLKRSNIFKDSIKQLNEQLASQRDRNIQHISEILNETSISINLLDQIHSDAVQLIPQLSERTKNSSESLAKIVTNLQYQDIIRQKIDHIQQTHKDILDELNQINNSEGDINVHTKVKCFIQIRDVAGLQAAQLIHTNKEYQKAIESISGKFIEVGSDMNQISDLCQQLIGNRNSNTFSYFDEIREKVEHSHYFSEIFEKSLGYLQEKTNQNKDQLASLVDNYNELSDFFKTIEKSILKALDSQESDGQLQYETTSKQIRSLLTDLNQINCLYLSQFEKIKSLCACAVLQENNTDQIEVISNKLRTFNVQTATILENLYENNENGFKIIADNQSLSKRVSSDIKASIEQIKYYDFFDKVIEEIILRLNSINMKLQNIDIQSEEAKIQHLEFLKSRYTMESEHIIHEHLTKQDVDLEHLNSTGADEDDDNLELF